MGETKNIILFIVFLIVIFVGLYINGKTYQKGYDLGKMDAISKIFEDLKNGEIECPEDRLDDAHAAGYSDAIIEIEHCGLEKVKNKDCRMTRELLKNLLLSESDEILPEESISK